MVLEDLQMIGSRLAYLKEIMFQWFIIQTWILFCMVYFKVQSLVLFFFCFFLIHINDLNQAIKFCEVYHFADDTDLLHFGKSIIKLDKYINLDKKNLTDWLNANKISLNVQNTELVIFKLQRKKIDSEVKIKLSRKQLYPTDSLKYLGIGIDENLKWKMFLILQ